MNLNLNVNVNELEYTFEYKYKGGGVAALERDLYHAQFSLPPLQLQVMLVKS